MVVHQVDVAGPSGFELEYDSPVARYIDGIVAGESTVQLMQPISGPAQMFNAICCFKVSQDQFNALALLRMNSTAITFLLEALQATMLETSNHDQCRCDKRCLSRSRLRRSAARLEGRALARLVVSGEALEFV